MSECDPLYNIKYYINIVMFYKYIQFNFWNRKIFDLKCRVCFGIFFLSQSKLWPRIYFFFNIYKFLCQVDRHSHWHEKYFFPAEPTEPLSSASLTPFIDRPLKCSKSDTMQDVYVQISKNKTLQWYYMT